MSSHPLLNLTVIPEKLATNIMYDIEHNLEQWLIKGVVGKMIELCQVYNMQQGVDKFFRYKEDGKIILGNLPKLHEEMEFSPSINVQLFSGIKYEAQIDLGDNRILNIERKNNTTEITITSSEPESNEGSDGEPSVELASGSSGEIDFKTRFKYTLSEIDDIIKNSQINPVRYAEFINSVPDENFKQFMLTKSPFSSRLVLIKKYDRMRKDPESKQIQFIEDIKKAAEKNNENACIYLI